MENEREIKILTDLHYSQDHLWVCVLNGMVEIGVIEWFSKRLDEYFLPKEASPSVSLDVHQPFIL